MITTEFDGRTMVSMEVALERACHRYSANIGHHDARKYIADRILQCVNEGERTLLGMTRAGYRAAAKLMDSNLDCEEIDLSRRH